MSINISWHNDDKTIIYYQFDKGWQWHQLSSSFQTAHDMIEAAGNEVDVIMDFSDSWASIPQGAISQARQAFAQEPHPLINDTVLIGNQFVKSLTDMVKKFVGNSANNWTLYFATSLKDALAIIEKSRETRKNHDSV